MESKKIILIILLFPVIIFALFNLIGFSYNFIVEGKNIPSYDKLESVPELSSICKKIENKTTQDFCYALEKNDFSSLDSSICESEFFFNNYDKDFCHCHFEHSSNKKCQSHNKFVVEENLCKEDPNEISCLALTKNPYYCEKKKEFMDSAEKDECYKIAAIKWGDPFLCNKMIYNKDSCYFYLAVKFAK